MLFILVDLVQMYNFRSNPTNPRPKITIFWTINGNYTIIPGEGIFYPLYNEGKASVHQRVYYIKANNYFIKDKYLYYWWLKNNNILYKNSVGTTVKSLRINNFTSPIDVFEKALAHEKFVTKSIMDIYKNAIKEGEIVSQQFLNKYLEEQREEEDKMNERLMRLKLAGDNTSAILLLDHEQK